MEVAKLTTYLVCQPEQVFLGARGGADGAHNLGFAHALELLSRDDRVSVHKTAGAARQPVGVLNGDSTAKASQWL